MVGLVDDSVAASGKAVALGAGSQQCCHDCLTVIDRNGGLAGALCVDHSADICCDGRTTCSEQLAMADRAGIDMWTCLANVFVWWWLGDYLKVRP